jgi:hypothetical protein
MRLSELICHVNFKLLKESNNNNNKSMYMEINSVVFGFKHCGKFSLDFKICDPILLTWNLQIKSTIFSERLVSLIG